LDGTFLKKLGLTKQKMVECNALFFYQLLLFIVDPSMSGIKDNTRMGYYKEVARNTIMYAFGHKNRGGTHGHVFCPTTAEELPATMKSRGWKRSGHTQERLSELSRPWVVRKC
jgi:hypothetical protein